jgi:Flp pilus assembly protein TadG
MIDTLSNFLKTMIALRSHASSHSRFAQLVSDRRGVAAIEFALIAPLMLAMCLVTWELALAIETSRKVGRAGSMIGDLAAQLPSTSKSEVEGILAIGSSIVQPYNRSDPEITVTAIEITDDPGSKVQVAWSYKLTGKDAGGENKYAPGLPAGTATTVPEKLKIPGSFLIRVESGLDYLPVIIWEGDKKAAIGLAATRAVYEMNETYYLRPRVGQTIACGDCYN